MNVQKATRLLLVGACMALSGCSSFYMKASPFYDGPDSAYTAPVEQRINLWPLLYSRDPALSVIWPLYTQNADCWYAWPALTWMDDGDFVSLPLLTWRDRDGFVSLPLLTWTDHDDFVSLPLLTWKNGDEWTSLPIMAEYKTAVGPTSDGTPAQNGVYTFLAGLGGATLTNDQYASSYLFPFYADNEESFHSLFYCRESDDSWSVPLLGTSLSHERGYDRYTTLLLAGCSVSPTGYRGSYLFPLYIQDEDAFYTLPFGVSDTSWWVTPLWIHTKAAELALMGLCGVHDRIWWATPAAIGTENGFYGLFGLLGWKDDGPNWCVPLYWADPKENRYASLLAGSVDGYSWWCTPLVSTYRNDTSSGFWAWPLLGWSTTPDTDRVWWLSGLPLWTREKSGAGTNESILWRLWHKETRGGNVTVDCFPGITYDAHADGYEKTSFLWRCYRDEVIPGKGRNLDILFIPFSSAD